MPPSCPCSPSANAYAIGNVQKLLKTLLRFALAAFESPAMTLHKIQLRFRLQFLLLTLSLSLSPSLSQSQSSVSQFYIVVAQVDSARLTRIYLCQV